MELKFSKPLITNAIKTSIRNKDCLYKTLLRTKNVQQKEILHEKFNRYRNYTNILTRKSKANHYHRIFQEHGKNMCKTWDGIKSIININKTSNKSINCLKINENEETNSETTHLEWLSEQFSPNDYSKN